MNLGLKVVKFDQSVDLARWRERLLYCNSIYLKLDIIWHEKVCYINYLRVIFLLFLKSITHTYSHTHTHIHTHTHTYTHTHTHTNTHTHTHTHIYIYIYIYIYILRHTCINRRTYTKSHSERGRKREREERGGGQRYIARQIERWRKARLYSIDTKHVIQVIQ